jgi:hypothetical protein
LLDWLVKPVLFFVPFPQFLQADTLSLETDAPSLEKQELYRLRYSRTVGMRGFILLSKQKLSNIYYNIT